MWARKRLYFGLVILLLFAASAGSYLFLASSSETTCDTNPALQTTTVTGNGHSLTAEIARDDADRVRGLSGRNCLDTDRALLFRYDLTGDYCFWMKDMRFPIDMIWLDDEKKIVTIKEKVSPDTYPQEFCPNRPAQYIIETAAGRSDELGWRLDTSLSF